MAVTGTLTYSEIINAALRKIGVIAIDSEARADDVTHALKSLNRMLKSWQSRGYNIWAKAEQTVPLTTAASYTLNPVRPLKILSARLVRSGVETPMIGMTRDEYDSLPVKTSTGLPTQYYYDRQREAALFYVWPVLSVADGETVKITYEREFEDATDVNDDADVPGEWYEAVVYNLAAKLADDYEIAAQMVRATAREELFLAMSFDHEESVFFAGPYNE